MNSLAAILHDGPILTNLTYMYVFLSVPIPVDDAFTVKSHVTLTVYLHSFMEGNESG